jgi:hypothetical protein
MAIRPRRQEERKAEPKQAVTSINPTAASNFWQTEVVRGKSPILKQDGLYPLAVRNTGKDTRPSDSQPIGQTAESLDYLFLRMTGYKMITKDKKYGDSFLLS